MNSSPALRRLVVAIAALGLLPSLPASGATLVLDDPLSGSTRGTRSGGEFAGGGWRVSGQYDSIFWHVPTISHGAVEFDVRGLRPGECRAGMEDKSELFHMYDHAFGDSDSSYNGGYRDNPFKHFIRKIGCAGGTVDALELVWKIGDEYVEPDSAVLSWDPAVTYRFREEWGTEGGSSVIRTYRDGVLVRTMSLPGDYAPAGHSVRIAASTRRAADAGAPVGAIYSNVEVWDLSTTIPAAPRILAPASGETVRGEPILVRWTAEGHDRYRVRVQKGDSADAEVAWASGDVVSPRDFAWLGALPDGVDLFASAQLGTPAGWGPWSARRRFRIAVPAPGPGGAVRVEGSCLVDDGGPFLGLGATYMQALRRCKHDRARLESDLAFLARQGFGYVRVLSMVGWYPYWEGLEIAPVTFVSQAGRTVPAWPDYWQQLRDLVDLVAAHGMRTQVTVFADAQLMPAKADRIRHLDLLLASLEGREDAVALLEVANEAWQNGFPGTEGVAEVRELGAYLAQRTAIPVALSATAGGTNASLEEMYRGGAADIATEHFSRDLSTGEGGWLPVRDCWRAGLAAGVPPASSNEPIGPGSSVQSESDPVRLVSAAAFAFTAGLPMYVFHSSAGVKGLERFEAMPGVDAYARLRETLPPDLPGWVRHDGLEEAAPFTVYCDGRADAYWTEVPGASSGCHRCAGARKGPEFVSFPMGILEGGLELEARRPVTFRAIDPVDGRVAFESSRDAGERWTLPRGRGAYILRGTVHDGLPARTLRIQPARGEIRVDGDPEDWGLEEFVEPLRGGQPGSGDHAMVGFDGGTLWYAGLWTGGVLPEDASDHGARAWFRHDRDRLYALVRCDDSDLRTGNGEATNWANDCVEIYLDPAGDRGSAPLADSTSDVQLVVDAANRRNVYMCSAIYRTQVLAGVSSAVRRDAAGWWLEAAIEKGAIDPPLPDRGSFGLDLSFRDNDADNDPARTTVYTWSDGASGGGFPSKVPDRWATASLEEPTEPDGRRVPNDCNRDAVVDLSDPLCVLGHLFLGSTLDLACGGDAATDPPVVALLDATGDGTVDISDPVYLLGHLFLGNPAPANGPIGECRAFPGCRTDACP